jgi:hypothetical protein
LLPIRLSTKIGSVTPDRIVVSRFEVELVEDEDIFKDNDAKKAEISDDIDKGKYKVVIGSFGLATDTKVTYL